MNSKPYFLAAALVSLSVATAHAGTATSYGQDSPNGIESDLLTGAEGTSTRQREVIHTDTQQFVVGQNFQLTAGDTYAINAIYLKSASNENWDSYTADLEIKVFEGSGESTTLLATIPFDLANQGDGEATSEVLSNDWVKFQFDSAITMTGGQDYSFLVFFAASSGDNNTHKWGFRREDTGIYEDGNQWEGRHNADPAYVASDWPSSPWNNVLADENDDFMFYVAGTVEDSGEAPEITKVEYNDTSDQISLWWDAEVGATYTVNWSADLLDFSGVVSSTVSDSETQPYTFDSPSANADMLFFRTTKNP